MRVFNVDLEWRYVGTYGRPDAERAALEAAHEQAMNERASFLQSLGLPIPSNIQHPQGLIVSEQHLVELMVAGEKPEIKQEVQVGRTPGDLSALIGQLDIVIQKLLATPSVANAYNEKVSVHMPGQALATYNEVQLLEDVCSDVLQSSLDSGWRIIAACPQPDARRPDYILGRFNPAREQTTRAERN